MTVGQHAKWPPEDAAPGSAGAALGRPLAARTSPRRRVLDRVGRLAVSIGGVAIIAAILGILAFILVEVVPLALPAKVALAHEMAQPSGGEFALLGDERRTATVALSADGHVRCAYSGASRFTDLAPTDAAADPDASGTALPLSNIATVPGASAFVAATTDARAILVPVQWRTPGDGGPSTPTVGPRTVLELDPAHRPPRRLAARMSGDGAAAVVAQLSEGSMVLARRSVESNAITGEQNETLSRREFASPRRLTALAVDADARQIYGGAENGDLVYWPVADGLPGNPVIVSTGGSAVTALAFLIGDRSLVVGQADGSISVWLLVRQADQSFRPARAREFGRRAGAIRALAASPRDKGFLALDDEGGAGLYYSTSHRTLWTARTPAGAGRALFFSPKADGALVGGADRVAAYDIHNPHPEISLKALFGKIWYEGAPGPRWVWQSSSGTDDFEPKLSLTPLLFGTLKGTFYSLILAIPLGVLGAMYTSQFMHHSLKRVVKPTIEIMAALPSVVLGFMAGLWLAPRVEKSFTALLLMVIVLPAMAIAAHHLFHRAPSVWRARRAAGSEVLIAMALMALGAWACLAVAQPVDRLMFPGGFPNWLREATGVSYDQRNAIIVGLAMGFAVIPIIFSVAEEAFSNVPRGLVAGSLALGASRWQTVTRVVLPSASPGIFSAIMIGFGRAVGETMIVLMATGNTPVMDWSPFNGFRTLSANIAVEIPEAAVGATLYRTLFLAGLLLFVLTFLVNTAAEVVRQKLRRRYSDL